MEPRNVIDNSDKLAECILASVVEVIQRSCESEEQALRVQTAHYSDITSFMRYTQVVEHYKRHCFDWTSSENDNLFLSEQYSMAKEYLHLFVGLSEEKIPVERIKRAIEEVGRHLKR